MPLLNQDVQLLLSALFLFSISIRAATYHTIVLILDLGAANHNLSIEINFLLIGYPLQTEDVKRRWTRVLYSQPELWA